ncbi:PE family protein, partial [Mycobacterium tuberculosis]
GGEAGAGGLTNGPGSLGVSGTEGMAGAPG